METQEKKYFLATGRRKEATARVKVIIDGKGTMVVNNRDAMTYFCTVNQRNQVKRPLIVTQLEGKVDVLANATGGGPTGQAGAISLGIARCLLAWNPELRAVLRTENLLTRDPRAKERKKYGRKGARRRFQWTKR